jgi:hypothetical protein
VVVRTAQQSTLEHAASGWCVLKLKRRIKIKAQLCPGISEYKYHHLINARWKQKKKIEEQAIVQKGTTQQHDHVPMYKNI